MFDLPESITGNPGILAAIIGRADTHTPATSFFGEGAWQPMLDHAMKLLLHTTESFVRLAVGEHTVIVQREGEVVIGCVVRTGHAVTKSLHRMIRRALAPKQRGRPAADKAAA